jgi:outer membrane protein assembly factor BamB
MSKVAKTTTKPTKSRGHHRQSSKVEAATTTAVESTASTACSRKEITVADLAVKFEFEIIPLCPAASQLLYTDDDRAHAEVLTGPVFDRNNFYYSAYSGNIFSNNFKSAIFFARDKFTGALIYAKNTELYSLDTGANFLGPPKMVTRTLPAIVGNKIYLTSGWISNIGPQLFCLDKATGDLIYAIAYYLPWQAEQALGVRFLTTKADYSQFKGSQVRLSDQNILTVPGCHDQVSIYLGSSSLQNAFNPGLIPNPLTYTGYPFFTDQGFLFKIDELNSIPELVWSSPTCARALRPGEILTKGEPQLDPFLPARSQAIIGTVAVGGTDITSPGPVKGLYYFAQVVMVDNTTVRDANLFAPFWNTLPGGIFLGTDSVDSYTLAEVLPLLQNGKNTIYTTLADVTGVTGTPATGSSSTNGLWYTKIVSNGDVIANEQDANALNYWGNDTWGAGALLDDCAEIVYFHSGQTHSMPLDEHFQGPDYITEKQPLKIAADNYVNNQTPANLQTLNQVKDQYQNSLKFTSLAPYRSPRGQRSYCDALLAASPKTGRPLFAARSLPIDVYTFLGEQDPAIHFFGGNDADGDASSGVFLHQGKATVTTKNGCAPILDVSKANHRKWNHQDLESVGVVPKTWVYTGPNGVLGGSNYQSTQHEQLVFTVNANAPAFLGTIEKFVTREGLYIPQGAAFGLALDLIDEKVIWNTQLGQPGGAASGCATYCNGTFLTCNVKGFLFALDEKTGQPVWELNSGQRDKPMNGGVASPAVDPRTGQIYWIASYNIPANPAAAGAWGYVLASNPELTLECSDYSFLNGQTYRIQHETDGFLVNDWVVKRHRCSPTKFYVNATLILPNDAQPVTNQLVATIDEYSGTVTFVLRRGGSNLGALLISARFINKDTYLLTWYQGYSTTLITTLMSLILPQ